MHCRLIAAMHAHARPRSHTHTQPCTHSRDDKRSLQSIACLPIPSTPPHPPAPPTPGTASAESFACLGTGGVRGGRDGELVRGGRGAERVEEPEICLLPILELLSTHEGILIRVLLAAGILRVLESERVDSRAGMKLMLELATSSARQLPVMRNNAVVFWLLGRSLGANWRETLWELGHGFQRRGHEYLIDLSTD